MGIRRDTISGVTWIGAFRGITRVISLIKTAILARVLSPSQFGVFGVAALTMSLLEVFTETGINTILIQLKKDTNSYLNSAFVVSIIRGVVISATMLLVSGTVATFFNIPDSRNLILLASLIPLVRGFINPSEIKFQKDLLFKQEFIFRTSIFVVDATVSIIAALLTRRPESLIWGILAGAIFEMAISHIFISPRPKFIFEIQKTKFILKRGKWMTMSGILDYLVQNGDNIVVGKLLGSVSLGLYQMSYQLSTAPITEISTILSKVTFPIFMKISDQKDRLFTVYLKLVSSIFVVVGLISLLLILVSEPLVVVFLGNKWLPIVPVIRVLAIFSLVKSIVLSSYALFLSNEKQEIVTIVSLTGFVSMFIVILPLVTSFGIIGAAYAALFGALVSIIPATYFIRK